MRRSAHQTDVERQSTFESIEERIMLTAHAIGEVFHHDAAAHEVFTHERVVDVVQPQEGQLETTLADIHQTYGVAHAHDTYGLFGGGQTVAVIDSGIAYDHYALGGGLGAGYRVVGGWDFTGENDADPYDDGPAGFHGTHVAGIVGSSDSTYQGVAPEVDLVALRVFDDQGAGYFSWVEDALQWVITNKDTYANPITTVNLSLGTSWNDETVPSWTQLENEFQQLHDVGIFVSVSAGNSFQEFGQQVGLSYPAVSPWVVPVASVTNGGAFSSFSQRHDRVIAAPGQAITSTVPDYLFGFDGVTDDFGTVSGTSMAAPFVAGAATIVRQTMEFNGYTNITQDTIYDHMRATADIFYDPVTAQSYHRLNLQSAIDSLMPDDDYGTGAGAHSLGSLAGATSVSGVIGTLADVDSFSFTAGQSGAVTFTAQTTHDLAAEWNVTGATATTTGNVVSFDVVAGQSYVVDVNTTDGIGYYDVDVDLVATTVDWGTVEFTQFDNENLSANDNWYQFTTTRAGIVSVEAMFNNASGNVDLQVYDSSNQLLGSSTSTSDLERVDVTAAAGETLFLRVTGSNSDVDLQITNLVALTGGTAHVHGLAGDDSFSLTTGAQTHSLTVNGVSYSFAADIVTNIQFHGNQGVDTIDVTGTSLDDTAVLNAGAFTFSSNDYYMSGDSVESVSVYGGGGMNLAFMYDTAGDETFTSYATASTISGSGFSNSAEGFARVYAYANSGGQDVAHLHGSSADNTLIANAAATFMNSTDAFQYANGFDQVFAYGGGGMDQAHLYDTAGDETYTSYATHSTMTGEGFYNHASGFDQYHGYANAGGNDLAQLYGSTASGTFIAHSTYSYLNSSDAYQYARGFDQVHAFAGSGTNKAFFYDTAGDETFTGGTDYSIMQGDGFYNLADGFDHVFGYATAGGQDTAYLNGSLGSETFIGLGTYSYLRGGCTYQYAGGFDQVYADGGGGADTAYLYDTVGDETFTSYAQYSEMQGTGFINRAGDFDVVYALSSGNGVDHAYLHGSEIKDTFVGHATYSYLISASNYNFARGFDQIHAYGGGGFDLAYFYDTAGDETFTGHAQYGVMEGSNFYNFANGFDAYYAYSYGGGDDRAFLYGSEANDTFVGLDTYSYLSSADAYQYAGGFVEVCAYGEGGNDQANIYEIGAVDAVYGEHSMFSVQRSGLYQEVNSFGEVVARTGTGEAATATMSSIDYLFAQVGDWT